MTSRILASMGIIALTLTACEAEPMEDDATEPNATFDNSASGITELADVVDVSAVAPFCSGVTCNGKNPQGTNCQNSAYRVFGYGYPIGTNWGTVELWYSPACNANWGRAYSNFGQTGVWLEQNGRQYPVGGKPVACSGNTCWSAMRNGTPTTRACGYYSVYEGCSPWG